MEILDKKQTQFSHISSKLVIKQQTQPTTPAMHLAETPLVNVHYNGGRNS